MITNKEIQELIEKYENLFKESKKLPPIKSNYVHSIPTKGIPPFCRPRRLSPNHLGALRRINRPIKPGHISAEQCGVR